MGRYYDDGHFGIDEGYGAVFHFSGGITLCMDIRDFFQFQRPFQRYGIVVPSAQIDEVMGVGENFCKLSDTIVEFQHLFHFVWYPIQLADDLLQFFGRNAIFGMSQRKCQHGEYRNLSGECFGRCYTDFWPYVYERSCVGGSGDR